MGWKKLTVGAVILEPGNAMENKTGSWRTFRPVLDRTKCTNCLLCHVYCPEGCITIREDETIDINLDYCKGCGICGEECPVNAIVMIGEEE